MLIILNYLGFDSLSATIIGVNNAYILGHWGYKTLGFIRKLAGYGFNNSDYKKNKRHIHRQYFYFIHNR